MVDSDSDPPRLCLALPGWLVLSQRHFRQDGSTGSVRGLIMVWQWGVKGNFLGGGVLWWLIGWVVVAVAVVLKSHLGSGEKKADCEGEKKGGGGCCGDE